MQSTDNCSLQEENEFESKSSAESPSVRRSWCSDHFALMALSSTTVTNGRRRCNAGHPPALDDASDSHDWPHPLERILRRPYVLDGDHL